MGTTSAAQVLTVSNTGNLALAISGIALTGSNPGDFAQTNNCPASLGVGLSCTINVTFKPTLSGTRAASVTISSNDPTNPQFAVPLTGTGTASITMNWTAIHFGNQAVGVASPTTSVTLKNNGVVALSLSGITTPSADFTVNPNSCGATLAAGASCIFRVAFLPTSLGLKSATMTVSASGTSLPLALDGTGVAPGLYLNWTALNFGSIVVGGTSTAITVTATNATATAATVSAVTVPTGFILSNNNCTGTTLQAGQNCTVRVAFRPLAAQVYSGNFTMTTNGPSASIPVSGTGLASGTLSLNWTALNFGSVPVNTVSGAATVTVTNQSATAVTVSAVTVPAGFTLSNNSCTGASVPSGQSCFVAVRFAPTAVQTYSGSFTVTTSGPSATIPVSGRGI